MASNGAVDELSELEPRQDTDFAAAGRQILAEVDRGHGPADSKPTAHHCGVIPPRLTVNYGAYEPADAIWRHPVSGALLLVGDKNIAHSTAGLEARKVHRIVHCQSTDGWCPFENDPKFRYLKFPVGEFRSRRDHLDISKGGEATLQFFDPLFEFVDFELTRGNNVLIHCLAGAHRAGTCGVACLMYFYHRYQTRGRTKNAKSATSEEAVKPGWHTSPLASALPVSCATTAGAVAYARGRRPIINPAGYLPVLLVALERTLAGEQLPSPRALQREMVVNFNFAC
jgi:hypothetical protein